MSTKRNDEAIEACYVAPPEYYFDVDGPESHDVDEVAPPQHEPQMGDVPDDDPGGAAVEGSDDRSDQSLPDLSDR
eukprot:10949651-Alexandrium_andersonii.AAC.1